MYPDPQELDTFEGATDPSFRGSITRMRVNHDRCISNIYGYCVDSQASTNARKWGLAGSHCCGQVASVGKSLSLAILTLMDGVHALTFCRLLTIDLSTVATNLPQHWTPYSLEDSLLLCIRLHQAIGDDPKLARVYSSFVVALSVENAIADRCVP